MIFYNLLSKKKKILIKKFNIKWKYIHTMIITKITYMEIIYMIIDEKIIKLLLIILF